MTLARVTPKQAFTPAPVFTPDELLDDTYRITKLLAEGGIGEIYEATHVRLSRNVAVKVLNRDHGQEADWITRFGREALILGQLRHPNIVDVLDFNVAPGGAPYLVMELVEGADLEAAMRGGRRFAPAEVMSIVRQVASALSAAHARGIVHRDLKAENVVLCEAPGQLPIVKVIDFGIALDGSAQRVTAEHTVFGTPEYMAPEQAQGLRDQIDARTDQFALAVLAYRLLAGRAPYAGETPVALLFQVVYGRPASLGPCEGWDSARADQVIHRALSATRENRYPSVLDFADALEAAMREGGALPGPARAPLPVDRTTRRIPAMRARRARSVPRLLFAAALALGVSLPSLGMSGRVRESVTSGWALLADGATALVVRARGASVP